MKTGKKLLFALATVLVLGAGISPAWSYFTAYSEASGALTIKVEPTTTITEEFTGGLKKITIHNADDSDVDVYVRARVFVSDDLKPTDTLGEGWEGPADDGWYYYKPILKIGSDTTEINFKVKFPEEPEEGQNFNVIVLYESTPVKYTADGQPYADWEMVENHKSQSGEVVIDG